MITITWYNKNILDKNYIPEQNEQLIKADFICNIENYYQKYLTTKITLSDWIGYSQNGQLVDDIFCYLTEKEKNFFKLNNKFKCINKKEYLTQLANNSDENN